MIIGASTVRALDTIGLVALVEIYAMKNQRPKTLLFGNKRT